MSYLTNASVLAVDLGGTVIKAGLVRDGTVLARASIEGHSDQGLAQALPRLAQLLISLKAPDTESVAIALPTLVDSRIGKVLTQMKGKYDGLIDTDLSMWCRTNLGMQLRIENDAHAALLGEWRYGAARGCDDLVMITLGTGIGTSVLIRGRPLRGAHGQAGNLGGHIMIDPFGPPCVCGGRGCVEALQHLYTVGRIARSDPRFPSSPLSQLDVIDYAALSRLKHSDTLSSDLFDRSLSIWSGLCVSMIHQFDPQMLLVGGGIMKSSDVIIPAIRHAVDRACTPWGHVEVKPAILGDDAALIGLASMMSHPPEYL